MSAGLRGRMLRLVVPLALCAAARPAPRCVFVATVADATSNAPVTDAEVSIPDLSRSVRTNWIGEVVIPDVPTGRHRVHVRRIGYVEADVNVAFAKDTVGVFFRLAPRAQSLDTVRAISKTLPNLMMGEFESRRRMGIGRFLTDSMLMADSTLPLADIIERHFPGLRSVAAGRTVGRLLGGTVCALDVYIDGARTSTSMYSLGHASDATDLRFFFGGSVAGVEYYTDVSAPVQYRHQSMPCGVLLIWLRY